MEYKAKAAMYLRKSRSDSPDESIEETLSRHKLHLTEFALKNEITISEIYTEVVSGDGLFTRPEMIRLLNDVEAGKYTAVLCMDIDRLGRSSTKDSGIIMETLKDAGCYILTPDKTYNLDDDVDEMTVELKSFFARQELKSIRKRLMRGEIATLKAGGHTGEPPYAYKRKWIGKTPTLEIIPEQAETVRLIYDMYVNQHIGAHLIAEHLNKLGIKSPDGVSFSRSTVQMILKNPTYTGKIVWNRMKRIKKKKPTDKYKEIANPESEWIVVQGLHEAIISEEMFNEAERIRKTRSHPPTWAGVIKNPYSGIAFCANCGAALQRQIERKTGEARLLCTTKNCNASIRLSLFNDRIKSLLETELNRLKLEPESMQNTTAENIRTQITACGKTIRSLKGQMNKLYDLLEQGVYTVPIFMERQSNIRERISETENTQKALIEQLSNMSINAADIIPKIEELLRTWDTLIESEKNIALKSLIRRINYRRESRCFKEIKFDTDVEWRF